MIDNLVSNPTIRMLEQTLNFTEQRHNVLLSDIANASTPGYVQKDVSVADFQKSLRQAVVEHQQSFNDEFEPKSNAAVEFTPGSSSLTAIPTEAAGTETGAMAFHDKGVRSMEYLMGQMGDNAMAHNVVSQLLKSRYDWVNKAIQMKP